MYNSHKAAQVLQSKVYEDTAATAVTVAALRFCVLTDHSLNARTYFND